jgi:hypothetical protein
MLCRRASRRRDRTEVFEESWLLLGGHPQQLLTCKDVSHVPLLLGEGESLMVRAEAILVLVLLLCAELCDWHVDCSLS